MINQYSGQRVSGLGEFALPACYGDYTGPMLLLVLNSIKCTIMASKVGLQGTMCHPFLHLCKPAVVLQVVAVCCRTLAFLKGSQLRGTTWELLWLSFLAGQR